VFAACVPILSEPSAGCSGTDRSADRRRCIHGRPLPERTARLLLEDKRTYLFSTVCRTVLEDLREHDPTAQLNIMEIDYRLIRSLSVFKVIYTLGMGDDPDKNPQLKLTQGVPGQAVARKGFCVADLESKHTPMFGLTADQYDKTKELTLVLSMPIKRTEKMPDGSFVLADDVIGVVNIDTKRPSAHMYYESIILYFNNGGSEGISLLDWQWRRMQEISELSSYILS
jgi:hypothetical protein